jgi:transcriptional regulator with XRE-family HTH domain
MVIPKEITNRIKDAREKKNYSQQYLAEQLGISQKAYSKIENGETKLTVDNLLKISKVLEVNLNELFSTDSFSIYNNYHTHNGEGIVVNKQTSEKVQELYERLLKSKDEEIKLLRDRLEIKNG